MTSRYDFVIVGAGSAGCVLASRLSEDPSVRVALLEAGPPDHRLDWRLHMPAALAWPLMGTRYNWAYETEPEPGMNDRRMYCPRGRVIGGSSSINGMVYIRGNPRDYDSWATRPGLDAWSYAHCLPYFRRAETRVKGSDDYRGEDGPLRVSTGQFQNPLFQAFINAGQQAGFPYTSDINGYCQEGVGPFDMTVWRGRRWSAASAYLRPAAGRSNLTVHARTTVEGLRWDEQGRRITGVIARQGRRQIDLQAGEVIVCAGAINSPQLLQASGIGDPAHLEPLGIPTRVSLPGVGRNLQDHLEAYVQTECLLPVSLFPALRPFNQLKLGLRWLVARDGIGASNQFEAGGFTKSDPEVDYPNVQYHFLPVAMNYDGSKRAPGHGYQLHVGPMRSSARGAVRIRSADLGKPPAIQFNYLTGERDEKEWIDSIRQARRILAQEAFTPYRGPELAPGAHVETDEAILDFVRTHAESAYHPSCTCAMGTDEPSVTGPDHRVHGVRGLRVIDASVMPEIVTGNLNAPTIMIAEKAADTLRGATPLPPSSVPYHGQQTTA